MIILVICESPAKIPKLQKYLDKISIKDKFIVKASYGHFRDLKKTKSLLILIITMNQHIVYQLIKNL